MSHEKDHLFEIYDVLQPLIIESGAIRECSIHPGCSLIESEDMAYAVATNAVKDGSVNMDRRTMQDAVQQILTETPDVCSACGG